MRERGRRSASEMQEDEEKRGEHTTISQGVVNKHFIRSGGNGSMNFISAKI